MKTHSFMNRLLSSYLVIALIPLLVLMMILLQGSVITVKKDVQQDLDSVADLISAQLEAVYNTMSFISLDIVADETFMSAANRLNYGTSLLSGESKSYTAASNAICSYSYTSASYNTFFFNRKGNFMTSVNYNTDYTYQYRLPENFAEQIWWLDRTLHNYGRAVLLPVSSDVLPDMDREALTLVRAVRNPGDIIGFLAVSIDIKDLETIFDVGNLNDMEFLVIYGDEVIYGSENAPVPVKESVNEEELLQRLREKYLVSVREQAESGITTIMISDMETVYGRTRETVKIYILEGLFIVALTILVIVLMTRQVSRPLVALSEEMQGTTLKNLGNAANDRIFGKYSETEVLYREFSKMRRRLDVMVHNEVALRTLQARERLHYLQSQINPHFLYNTLNIIGIMGADNGDDRIYDSCLKLSEILRYAISDKNSSTASFAEEFQNIRLYLELMKLRFEDRLTYDIQCDGELEEEQVLRLTLQPFVENVFEHALDAEHSSVNVSVRGAGGENGWRIVIEDNGAGMAYPDLVRMNEDILRYLGNPLLAGEYVRQQEGIGVKNTLIRLYLYYDGAFSYSLENREEGGFRVTLDKREN